MEGGPQSPQSALLHTKCFPVPRTTLATWSEEEVQPGVGGLARREAHIRSVKKKSLFVQISSVPLTAPSLFTGKAMGAP